MINGLTRALILSSYLLCQSAVAVTCSGPAEGVPKWVQGLVSESTYIFVARVARVSQKPSNKHGIYESAVVEIDFRLKGNTQRNTVDTDYFTNFPLKGGEKRVFFLDANGVAVGCSEYKHFASDERIIREIKNVLGKSAT